VNGPREDDDRDVGACDQPPAGNNAADAALESEFMVEEREAGESAVEVPHTDRIPRGRAIGEEEAESLAAELPPQLIEDLDELFRGRFVEVYEPPQDKQT